MNARPGRQRAATLAAIATVFLLNGTAAAKDLGVRGETWAIAEPDLLQVLEARLHELEQSGAMAVIEEEARARARARIEAPEPVSGIAPAITFRSRLVNPSVVLDRDVRLPDGTVLATAGTRLNPLKHVPLRRDLLFIDGRRDAEVAWALDRPAPATIVLFAGRPLDLARPPRSPVLLRPRRAPCGPLLPRGDAGPDGTGRPPAPSHRGAGQRPRGRTMRLPAIGVLAVGLTLVTLVNSASAQTCTGRFVNPIADVCWECLFPISIGPINIGSATGAPDIPNPSSPICLCGSPIPRIGLSIGVWEPARLVDVTRIPWCFPNLGGLTINPGWHAARGRTGSSGGDGASGIRLARAPLYVPAPLVDRRAPRHGLPRGRRLRHRVDVGTRPGLARRRAQLPAQPGGGAVREPPGAGGVRGRLRDRNRRAAAGRALLVRGLPGRDVPADRQRHGARGGVQASLLASQRLLYRLHRAGLAWGTSGSAALCARYPMPVMKKSQYRWQMTQPVPATSPLTGCNPTGRSSVLWETLRELPVAGENFGYLLWRKRNCCFL